MGERMGKKWNIFLSLATIAEELRSFVEVLRELIEALNQVSRDLEEERIHREVIYKMIREDALRRTMSIP